MDPTRLRRKVKQRPLCQVKGISAGKCLADRAPFLHAYTNSWSIHCQRDTGHPTDCYTTGICGRESAEAINLHICKHATEIGLFFWLKLPDLSPGDVEVQGVLRLAQGEHAS